MPKIPGDHLRDEIAQLLRIKFQNVVVEKRLNTTTADVFFIDDTSPIFPRKIAIESKDWEKRLSSQDIATIYNLYSPSLMSREIDYLWIIGRDPLSSSPRLSLDSFNNVRYSTFDEFRASLIDFTGLLNNTDLFKMRPISPSEQQDCHRHRRVVELHTKGVSRKLIGSNCKVRKTIYKSRISRRLSIEAVSHELAPLVRRLVARHQNSSVIFPIKIVGEIAERLEERAI